MKNNPSRVDFSYAFATPHRITVGRPEASQRTLLDLQAGSLRMAWSYDDLSDPRRYPLASLKIPPVAWELLVTLEIDGLPASESRWSRVDGWLPALENVFTTPSGRLDVKVFGCQTAAVAEIRLTNPDSQQHRFVLKIERPGNLTGYNPAWVDPALGVGDHLLAGWMERADRVILLGIGAQYYALNSTGRPPGPTTLIMGWDAAPGQVQTGWLVRPYEAYQADLPGLREKDWSVEMAAAHNEWQALMNRAAQVHIPDAGVENAFRACLADLFIMREPVGGTYIAGVPGTEVYRAANSFESAIMAVALDQLGLHHEAAYGFRMCLELQEPDGNWSEPKGWGHLMWGGAGFKAWAAMEHYRNTGDDDYLTWVFPRLAMNSRFQQRARERMKGVVDGDRPATYGLMPPGMGDGGLKDGDDLYGVFFPHNIWAVYADRLAVEAAEILHQRSEGLDEAVLAELNTNYTTAYADLLAALERGAIQEDTYRWIPGVPGKTSGSRWAALNALSPCRLLPPDHELIEGTLRKIEQNISLGGHPMNTGWMEDGCWVAITLDNVAEAHLARGNGDAAARYMYATINHATPLVTWCEERGQEPGTSKTSGDRQHLFTPVALVRCLRDMLVMEEGDGLHLALGADRNWLETEEPLGIERASTHFGQVSYSLKVDPATQTIHGSISFDQRAPLAWIAVHLRLPGKRQVVSLQTHPALVTGTMDEGFRWIAPQGTMTFEARMGEPEPDLK